MKEPEVDNYASYRQSFTYKRALNIPLCYLKNNNNNNIYKKNTFINGYI